MIVLESWSPYITAFLQYTEDRRIPVVLAAGNSMNDPLHSGLPQSLGTKENNIITVGGVRQDGSLYRDTSPDHPDQQGSMTVFAPAENVIAPGNAGERHENTAFNTGTSQAAAITVGLRPQVIFAIHRG